MSKLIGRLLRSCSRSSGKSKPPGRKGFGGATLQPRYVARTEYALNRQVNSLMETGYREEAYDLYAKILPSGCKPDSYTCLHLIKGFCKGGELGKARELFKRVLAGEEGNFGGGSEVILYNAMVHGLGSAGFVKEALDLVDSMRARGFAPDTCTYNSILHSLGKVGKTTEALTVFESMADMGCSPDVITYNSLISCLGKVGKAKEAYEVYEGMIKEGCVPDNVTFNTLIPILGKTGELGLAINLFEFMITIGFEPDVFTYTSLVTSLCRAKRIDEALLLSVVMTEKDCAPNTATFNAWLDGLCKGGRVVEARLLFDKMLVLGYVPDNITYSILIYAFCKTGQFMDKAFELLKELLKCTTCTLDRRTSDIVYQSFEKVGMLKQAKRITRNARAKQSRCTATGVPLIRQAMTRPGMLALQQSTSVTGMGLPKVGTPVMAAGANGQGCYLNQQQLNAQQMTTACVTLVGGPASAQFGTQGLAFVAGLTNAGMDLQIVSRAPTLAAMTAAGRGQVRRPMLPPEAKTGQPGQPSQ